MPNGSSKGKGVDKSSAWSSWVWDDRGYYYSSRYGPGGQLEFEYRYPETKTPQQEQQTPRTPGENPFYSGSSAAPFSSSGSSGGSYGTQEGLSSGSAQKTPANTTSSSYQTRATTTYPSSEPYYTTTAASGSQSSSSTATTTNYSSQLVRSGTSASNTGSHSSSVASPKSDYASSSQSYDASSDVTGQLRGMSLNSIPSTIPEQGYVDSSNTATSYQPQIPSNYIARAPNTSDKEKLDPRYRCISEKEQRKFWKVGRVFMMLWTEPAAPPGTTRNGTHYSTVWLDQGVYSEIRRFVVLKEGYGNSICSPIHTYNGQATLKPNLPERQQHTIIYTSKECPPEHSYTTPDGTFLKENLSKDPIRVRREQNGPEGDLGALSRLNYSKVYTVENFVRVLNIGMVERDWIPTLIANSYVRPSEIPVEKPTIWTNESEKKGKGKGKEGRRHRR